MQRCQHHITTLCAFPYISIHSYFLSCCILFYMLMSWHDFVYMREIMFVSQIPFFINLKYTVLLEQAMYQWWHISSKTTFFFPFKLLMVLIHFPLNKVCVCKLCHLPLTGGLQAEGSKCLILLLVVMCMYVYVCVSLQRGG